MPVGLPPVLVDVPSRGESNGLPAVLEDVPSRGGRNGLLAGLPLGTDAPAADGVSFRCLLPREGFTGRGPAPLPGVVRFTVRTPTLAHRRSGKVLARVGLLIRLDFLEVRDLRLGASRHEHMGRPRACGPGPDRGAQGGAVQPTRTTRGRTPSSARASTAPTRTFYSAKASAPSTEKMQPSNARGSALIVARERPWLTLQVWRYPNHFSPAGAIRGSR